jgi:hypothetical protein
MASFVWMLPTEPTYNRTRFTALAWGARSLGQKTAPTVSRGRRDGFFGEERAAAERSRVGLLALLSESGPKPA